MVLLDNEIVKDIVSKAKRIDGRKFDEYRKINVQKGIVGKANGSARVDIGNTTVMAGVKIEPGEPFPDTPDEGVLIVNAEFVPIASPDFEPGPPDEHSVELARVVDRMIRESKAIDMKKMAITKDEVWKVMIDIIILDHDGNLIDASGLAAVSALLDAKMPVYAIENDKVVVDYEKSGTAPLPVERKPVSVTVFKISNSLLLDLTALEEQVMDARLTVGSFERDGNILLCSMQKGGSGGFTLEEIDRAVDMAIEKGKELRALL
ncbi:MAG: exosome complex protein Rrp42 [Candidatus Aenigmarchaeota archaeon]|nr:exosome complex protein Rrp42 [Candidatus Aenigmarchaeota archaeon]